MHFGMLYVYDTKPTRQHTSPQHLPDLSNHLPLNGQLDPDGPQSQILNHAPLPS
jgi:hypothetical protein